MSKLTAGTYEKYNAKYSTLTLTDGEYALTVTPEKGGMATSFTKSGEEYLWLRDKNYESSDRPRCGVPILFPSCGKPDGGVHHFNGSDYPIEVHGFADLLPWQVKTAADDEIVLTLTPNGLTKFVYPFDFLLEMRYTLSGAKAGLELTVHNTSDKALPFSIGFHLQGFQAGECGLRYQVRHLFRERQGRAARRTGNHHLDPQGRLRRFHPPDDRRKEPDAPDRFRQRPHGGSCL